MRDRIIAFLKRNPLILRICWSVARFVLQLLAFFVSKQPKQILFASFGGRKFDDSPRALYEEICKRDFFKDYDLVWAFVDPCKNEIPRGRKIKMDSIAFFLALIQSRVWISNSGMDRDIFLKLKKVVKIETWHGTPLKKIGGDEHQNTLGGSKIVKGPKDNNTIRCAQSSYDLELFQRLFHATKESFLCCDLPRNDKLLRYTSAEIDDIRHNLGIEREKKVILYAPTYREYLWDERGRNLIAPPVKMEKWKEKLGRDYVLLFRAHYTVGTALNITNDEFVKNVSDYPELNDLYVISDMMISDYSSTFFDYSILDRPMFCFAYDLEEYSEKRGLYLDLSKELPCRINKTEDDLLSDIVSLNYSEARARTKIFHMKYAPNAGNASRTVVDKIIERLK